MVHQQEPLVHEVLHGVTGIPIGRRLKLFVDLENNTYTLQLFSNDQPDAEGEETGTVAAAPEEGEGYYWLVTAEDNQVRGSLVHLPSFHAPGGTQEPWCKRQEIASVPGILEHPDELPQWMVQCARQPGRA
jgi:hypothetical protein